MPEQKECLGLVLAPALPPDTGHDAGSRTEQPQVAAYRVEHSPTDMVIPSGCPVPQGTGLHSPHVQNPSRSPAARSYTQRTPTHTLIQPPACSAQAHIVCMLSLCTLTLRHALLGQRAPPLHAHTCPYICSPSAHTAPCACLCTPHTLFPRTHAPCAVIHTLYTLSLCTPTHHVHTHTPSIPTHTFCTHTLCTLTHPLYTLSVHMYTPAVYAHTSHTRSPCANTPLMHAHTLPTHSPFAHTHILCTLMQSLDTLSLCTHPPCACLCIPYTLSPCYTFTQPLHTLSPIYAHLHTVSLLPHAHVAAKPHGHPGGSRSYLPKARSYLLTAALPSLLPAQGIYLHY